MISGNSRYIRRSCWPWQQVSNVYLEEGVWTVILEACSSWNMLNACWLVSFSSRHISRIPSRSMVDVSNDVTSSANPHFSYWFLCQSKFKCTSNNVSINLSLHPFLSRRINIKLYERVLPSREIRRSNRRVTRLSISSQLTAGFLFSYACL